MTVHLECDECGRRSASANRVGDWWTTSDDRDLCPACAAAWPKTAREWNLVREWEQALQNLADDWQVHLDSATLREIELEKQLAGTFETGERS